MIFLASQSPRRKFLLEKAGYDFRTVPSAHEEVIHDELSPEDNAVWNALLKCSRTRVSGPRGIVLAADTLIDFKGKVVIKPRDRADAARILQAFSDKTHTVITAVALKNLATGRYRTFAVRSRVTFKKLSYRKIQEYLDLGEYGDKAGAYGFQGEGKGLVRRVSGSETNVVGLPMERLRRELSSPAFRLPLRARLGV